MAEGLCLAEQVILGHTGRFDAYAVTSRWGPHVTLQAGVVHLGRYWTTTARRSLKADAIRRGGWASATVGAPGDCRVLGGAARVLDPARPATLVSSPRSGILAGGAVLRLVAGQLDQLVGYAEAGRAVPDDFLPWGRVILVIEISDELRLGDGSVLGAKGTWAGPATALRPPARPAGRWVPLGNVAGIPPAVTDLGSAAGDCWLGLAAASGAVCVPGTWDPTTGRVRLGRDVLAALGVRLPGPACVMIHRSESRRPDRKLGLMVRGVATLVDVDAGIAEIALRTERVTFWDGFVTGTVTVGQERQAGPDGRPSGASRLSPGHQAR
jgi:hypothetical protein